MILAYGDHEVYDWVKSEYPEEIKSGRIKLAFSEQEHFRMAHAKNMAHRLGTGDVLVNLDADNVTGVGFSAYCANKIEKNPNMLLTFSAIQRIGQRLNGTYSRGMGGRVAVLRDQFERLHGYNEVEHNHWGGDDKDFIQRADRIGMSTHYIPLTIGGTAIDHNNDSRIEKMSEGDKQLSRGCLSNRGNPINFVKGVVLKGKMVDEGANPKGDFGCGELKTLKRDLTEETQNFEPKCHPEWVATYDKSTEKSRTGWSLG